MFSPKQGIGAGLLIMLAGILLASAFCQGEFNLLTDPVSDLGRLKTKKGFDNTVSHIVYASACIAAAVFMLSAGIIRRQGSLCLIAAGLLIMPVPYDCFLLLHQIASGVVVGGAWLYCTLHLYKHKAGRLPQFFFQTAVLLYAVLHITGSVYKEEFQTFAVIVIFLAMADSIRPVRLKNGKAGFSQPAEPERTI